MASPKSKIDLLTSQEVAKAAGVSYRQIDYYARNGYFSPVVEARGSGSQRLWDPSVVGAITDLKSRVAQCPFCSRDSSRSGRG